MKKLAAEACLFNVGYMCMKFLLLKLTDILKYLFMTLLIDCSIDGNTTNKTIKSVLCGFEYCVPSACFPPLCSIAAMDASKQFNPNFQSDVIIPGYCCLCVTGTSGFSHMKQGGGEAAGRDLTSALVCAFGLVSGTKTWLADRALPGSAERRASVTTTTKLTVHTQPSARRCRRAVGSVGGAWVRSGPLATVATPSCEGVKSALWN